MLVIGIIRINRDKFSRDIEDKMIPEKNDLHFHL